VTSTFEEVQFSRFSDDLAGYILPRNGEPKAASGWRLISKPYKPPDPMKSIEKRGTFARGEEFLLVFIQTSFALDQNTGALLIKTYSFFGHEPLE
jgi:hypothetical protein